MKKKDKLIDLSYVDNFNVVKEKVNKGYESAKKNGKKIGPVFLLKKEHIKKLLGTT